MDTSEIYIKMCDCQEIQEQWEPRWGDWIVGNDGVVFPVSVGQLTQILSAREEEQIVWLPQDQVFDMLGNEIETLVNEEKPAGTYELKWNAASLPSGVYFYQLRVGSFIETKKMLLLK